jgi:hypothetical protein
MTKPVATFLHTCAFLPSQPAVHLSTTSSFPAGWAAWICAILAWSRLLRLCNALGASNLSLYLLLLQTLRLLWDALSLVTVILLGALIHVFSDLVGKIVNMLMISGHFRIIVWYTPFVILQRWFFSICCWNEVAVLCAFWIHIVCWWKHSPFKFTQVHQA